MTRFFAFLPLLLAATPAVAQDAAPGPPAAPPPVVFTPGTGSGEGAPLAPPRRPEIACSQLDGLVQAIDARFYPTEIAPGTAPSRRLLDRGLLDKALAGYRANMCSYGRTAAPAAIVVVDFAKPSREPRLYRIDLRSGDGLDAPIVVAHGIGSDPNDDGMADAFGNSQDSLMSSLGAARGGEIYLGINGRSLRLDGLEPSNSSMRPRDIVVHSYSRDLLRYFNPALVSMRGGRPGTSEGCFVVEPDKRDWIMFTLADGGYLYSGYSGELPKPKFVPNQAVTFVSGTGATLPVAGRAPVSETPAEMPGIQPTAPILPAPAVSGQ